MEIHLVSSMNSDDESRLAPAMLSAIGTLLDRLPISYSLRIETASGNQIHHHHTPPVTLDQDDGPTQGADVVRIFDAPRR